MTEGKKGCLHLMQLPVGATAPGKSLQDVVDRDEIRELAARYAHRVAHNIPAADLYSDDGAFIMRTPGEPVMEIRGRAELDRMLGLAATGTVRRYPMIHNHLVTVHGDEAEGLCSMEVSQIQDGRMMKGSGYYEDRYRRIDGVWKFVVRDISLFFMVPIHEEAGA